GVVEPDTFSVQLNTNYIDHTITTLCGTAAVPANCQGWEQFIFDSVANLVHIQYWLRNYGAACSGVAGGGWMTRGPSCFKNIDGAPLSTQVSVTNLHDSILVGQFASGVDSVTFLVNGIGSSMAMGTNVVNAATGWTQTEFNVFGD